MASSKYVKWVQSVPKAWMGDTARRLWGGLARVLGDYAIDWLRRGLYQQHPELGDDAALPLIGSGRRMYQGRNETNADFRARLPKAMRDWARAGEPLSLLWALHLEGFDGVVLVQQNGRGYSLSYPVDNDEPRNSLVETVLGTNPNLSNHPWWTSDDDVAYTSRFAILFPAGAGAFARIGYATFTGTEDGSLAHPWPRAVWSSPFADTTYLTLTGAPVTTGPVTVDALDDGTKAIDSIAVGASGAFIGVVPVLAWAIGDNPFASMGASDFQRLRRIVNDWKPKKALCLGVFVLVRGRMWGWPKRQWGDGKWTKSEVVKFLVGE